MAELPSEVEVLRRQSVKAWRWFEDTVADVTAEQANWWPPGTANSIGATYLHVVINADVEINRLILDREPLVQRLGGMVGQPLAYDPERFDRWVRHGPSIGSCSVVMERRYTRSSSRRSTCSLPRSSTCPWT